MNFVDLFVINIVAATTDFASVVSNNTSRSKSTRCFDFLERCNRLRSSSVVTIVPRFSSLSATSISLSSLSLSDSSSIAGTLVSAFVDIFVGDGWMEADRLSIEEGGDNAGRHTAL
jgi:hypothetical protein